MIFTTQIDNTPCQCRVVLYLPALPGKFTGPPEDCYPGEPSEFEFEILDMQGNHSQALEDLCDDTICSRLQDEYEAIIKNQGE